jgi:hypothetical protein
MHTIRCIGARQVPQNFCQSSQYSWGLSVREKHKQSSKIKVQILILLFFQEEEEREYISRTHTELVGLLFIVKTDGPQTHTRTPGSPTA